jgi:hypothetical protein
LRTIEALTTRVEAALLLARRTCSRKRLGHQGAKAALPVIAAQLSSEEKARADAMLKPAPKKS